MVYQPVEAQLNNSTMNSRLFSTLLRKMRQRVFKNSLIIKSYLFLYKKAFPFLFVATVSSLIYFLCLKLEMMDWFETLLSKVGFALAGRALSFTFFKVGLTSLFSTLFTFALCLQTKNLPLYIDLAFYMDSGGLPSSSGFEVLEPMPSSGESSSSEASVNQQPLIPELEPPLLDENTRRAELTGRLRTNWWGVAYNERILDSFVRSQLAIERHVEAALVADGYSPQVVFEKRHQIRGFIFYPTGRALSEDTYAGYLAQITNFGTRQSVPYQRVIRAARTCNLFLD